MISTSVDSYKNRRSGIREQQRQKPRQERCREYQREQPAMENQNARNNDGNRDSGYAKSRYIYPSRTSQNKRYNQKSSGAVGTLSFEIPTSNIFEKLPNEKETPDTKQPSDSKKHKASSPLEADKTLKKYREHVDSDQDSTNSDNSYIDVDKSPQCDPPKVQGRTLSQLPIHTVEVPKSPVIRSNSHVSENISCDQTENQSGDQMNSQLINDP